MGFVAQESGGSDQNVKADAGASGLAAAAAGAVPSAGEAAAACDPLNETCPPSASGAQPATEDSPDKKKKNRCAVCKKKVGLTGEFLKQVWRPDG
jgi:hypothetical protein